MRSTRWRGCFTSRDVYNVTINDQWPQEGFDLDVEYPIVISELPAYGRRGAVMCSGEKVEKNVTATPRQAGYLETVRAMYEYTYYKDDVEVAQARGMSHLRRHPAHSAGGSLQPSGELLRGGA